MTSFSEAGLVTCITCGTANRIAAGKSGQPICGRCKALLPIPLNATGPVDAQFADPQPAAAPPVATRELGWKDLKWFALAAVAILAVVKLVSPAPQKIELPVLPDYLKPPPTLTLPQTPTGLEMPKREVPKIELAPIITEHFKNVEIPKAKLYVPFNEKRVYERTRIMQAPPGQNFAPFQVQVAQGADFYIKLVDLRNGRPVMTAYIQSGQSIRVNIPLGTFELRYASGREWYGQKHLFGPETAYAKADKAFHFTRTGNNFHGHTVTLIEQAGGNLPKTVIGEKDF